MGFQDFIPLILIFAIMYFLLIRPQQKKVKEHQNMVASLRRGDQVVTQGGLIGKVTKVKEDNEIEVEVIEGSRTMNNPDEIFPNNWIVFDQNKIGIFPMFAKNRLQSFHLVIYCFLRMVL